MMKLVFSALALVWSFCRPSAAPAQTVLEAGQAQLKALIEPVRGQVYWTTVVVPGVFARNSVSGRGCETRVETYIPGYRMGAEVIAAKRESHIIAWDKVTRIIPLGSAPLIQVEQPGGRVMLNAGDNMAALTMVVQQMLRLCADPQK